MAQISYGTITITDTTDIEDVYLIYKGSSSNTTTPSIIWSGGTNDWKTDITQVTGDYIWAITVFKRTGITITSSNYTDYYSDPMCLTGEPGTSISITSIKYSTLTTESQPANSTFTLTSPPTVPEGEWLWSRTLFSNGQSMYSKAKQGAKGDTGERGTSILKITTAPTAYTTTTGGFTPSYRVSLSTVKTQSGQSKVLVGDIIEYDSNHYRVGYVDSSYVYLGPITSIKGASGQSYYTYIRYSSKQSPTASSDVSDSPTGKSFVGIQTTTSSTVPAWNDSGWNWMKYIGTDGQPGGQGPQGVSVTQVRELYYLTNGNAPNKPTSQTTIYNDDRVGAWTSVVPEYIVNGNYYISLETTLSNSTKVWSDVVLNQALTDESYRAWEALSISQNANENAQGAMAQAAEAQYQAEALAAKVQHYWWDSTGAHIASGINGADVTEGTASTYGFNSLVGLASMTFGYNSYKTVELDGSIPALKFYKPSKTAQGDLTATLNSNGLVLSEGGIEAGTKNSTNYIYVYSKDDATNHTFNINSSGNKSDWRIVAGNKFGVDKAGNLYASNAVISGKITVSSDSNLSAGLSAYSTTSQMNTAIGIAEANASYSIEVKVTAIDYTDSSATLVAVPYYQGSTTLPTLPNGASYSYQWYSGTTALSNTSTAPTISGATTATLELGPGSDLATTYVCVISKP